MFDFGSITTWFDNLLESVMPSWAATVIECVIIGVVLLLVYALLAIFYIFYERKLCAWFQCRLGPMRVGPWGILQVFADMFKILIKELIRLENIDRFLFALAPYLVIIASVVSFSVLTVEMAPVRSFFLAVPAPVLQGRPCISVSIPMYSH